MRSMFAPREIRKPTAEQTRAARANPRSSDVCATGLGVGEECLGNIQTDKIHLLRCGVFQGAGEGAPFLALVAVCSSSGNAFGYRTGASEVTCLRCLAAKVR